MGVEAIGVRGLAQAVRPRVRKPVSFETEITLRNAQVRRISWVRRVRPAGPRL